MSAREEGIEQLSLPDMERRIANMIRYGKIVAVEGKRVKVQSGNITTGWLRWPAGSANSRKRRWDPPTVGEQVCMLAPTGDLRQATFIPGMYQTDHDAPSDDPDEDLAEYSDGTVIGYNVATHKLTANLQENTSLIMDRTSIKATRGQGSVEVTDTFVKAALATSNIEITASAITMTVGGTTFVLSGGGVTMNGTAMNINANIATTGTLTNNGKNVGSTHTHSGVQAGIANTGQPN